MISTSRQSPLLLGHMRALVYDASPIRTDDRRTTLSRLLLERTSWLGCGSVFVCAWCRSIVRCVAGMAVDVSWRGLVRGSASGAPVAIMPTPGKVPLAELPTGVLPASRSSSMRCRVQTRGEAAPPFRASAWGTRTYTIAAATESSCFGTSSLL